MTLYKKASDFITKYFSEVRNSTYLKINIIFAGVILLIFTYSGIFSAEKSNYPVVCIHEKLTGESCFSCGLSHSFSLIVRGRFNEAGMWNIYGMRIFLFFFSQLLLRIFFSVYCLRYAENRKWLIRFDIAGSVLIFAMAFYPFFRQLFSGLLSKS